jgi:hypothetical protein
MMVRNPVEFFRSATFVLVLALASGAAFAAPRSIGDCESIKQADAYNNCLASFGPVAHVGGPATPPPADESAANTQGNSRRAWTRSRRGARHAHGSTSRRDGMRVTRGKNGRVRTEINLKPK